jgi:hypothetical protein
LPSQVSVNGAAGGRADSRAADYMQLMLMLERLPAPREATRLRLFDYRPSLTHPELVLAAIEDERDDQILLVGEVADEAGQELVGDEAIAVGASAHRVGSDASRNAFAASARRAIRSWRMS